MLINKGFHNSIEVYGYDMAMTDGSPELVVLVIEDDISLRELYCEALRFEGYTIHTASDGIEGMEQFRMIAPDIILMDLMMP